MTRLPVDPTHKIKSREELLAWRRVAPGRVVFTNGVFDLLHPGHIDVLRSARACGDCLVVGLNTDASVKRLKGDDRPVRREEERAYVLAALEMVDVVTLFDEDTPLNLIVALEPDVIVKGGGLHAGHGRRCRRSAPARWRGGYCAPYSRAVHDRHHRQAP